MASPTKEKKRAGLRATLRGVGVDVDLSDLVLPASAAEPEPVEEERAGEQQLLPGMIVAGKFALVRLIAEGGLSQVFEAEDTLVGRRVALKVLIPERATNPDVVLRFRREAHATAMVSHPNVVTIFEVGRRSDGSLYIVQELLNGPTLHSHRQSQSHGRLDPTQALRIVTPLAGALASAHAVGVVHRDVKPANIVLARSQLGETVPKLIDFGVARLEKQRPTRRTTLVGMLIGTAQYMSPEQAMGESWVDGRSDVWALGVVLYELIAGRCPFEGSNDHAVLAKVLDEEAPRIETHVPDIRPELSALIHRALERDAGRRSAMGDMFVELSALTERTGAVPLAPVRARVLALDEELEAAGHGVSEDDAIPLGDDDYEEEVIASAVGASHSESLPPETVRGAELLVTGSWLRGTAQVQSEFASREVSALEIANRAADNAQRALAVNALTEAVQSAEIGREAATGEERGQLDLILTIAQFWLGRFHKAEQRARAAMTDLQVGSTGWFAALGHLAMARSRLGDASGLGELCSAADGVVQARLSAAQVIAECRLAVAMTRHGQLALARQRVRALRDRIDKNFANEPVVFAWLDVAFAERAAHVGDSARELSRRSSALERFTSAGDVRNACGERARMGAALLSLGAFDDAERVLHEALGIAQPMKLSLSSGILASLALAACRQDELPRARSLLKDALRALDGGDDCYTEGFARVVAARIELAAGDPAGALEEAALALGSVEAFPALGAHAAGVTTAALLGLGRDDDALEHAVHGMELLHDSGGAGEGESLLRLSHGLACAATGNDADARAAFREARERVLGLAERLKDPRHRQGFLERIAENARILELGAREA